MNYPEIQRIKNLLKEHEIDAALNALSEYIYSDPKLFKKYENEIILLSGKLKDLSKDNRVGLATKEAIDVGRNKVSQSILEILANIEKKRKGIDKPRNFSRSNPKFIIWLAGFVLFLFGVGIGYYYHFSKPVISPKDIIVESKDEHVRTTITDSIPYSEIPIDKTEILRYKVYPLVHPMNTDQWFLGLPVIPSKNFVTATVYLGGVGIHSAKDGEIFNVLLVLTDEMMPDLIYDLGAAIQERNMYPLSEVRNITVKRNY